MNVKAPQAKEAFEENAKVVNEANEPFLKNCPETEEEIANCDVPGMDEEDYLFFKSAYETNPVARAAMEAAGITFPDEKFEREMQERKKKRELAKIQGA